MKKTLSEKKNIIGLIIAAALLYFASKDIDFFRALAAIKGINLFYLGIATLSSYIAFFIRVFRTRIF